MLEELNKLINKLENSKYTIEEIERENQIDIVESMEIHNITLNVLIKELKNILKE